MKIVPQSRRSVVLQGSDRYQVIIPAKRKLSLLVYYLVWLIGWGFGEYTVIQWLLRGGIQIPYLFLSTWLVAWTAGGGYVVYALIWMAVGKEIIALHTDTLAIKRDVLGFGKTKEYDLGQIRNLQISPPVLNPYDWSSGTQLWGIGRGGPIAFDYGALTVRFGSSMDEAEARKIVRELKLHHPFLDSDI